MTRKQYDTRKETLQKTRWPKLTSKKRVTIVAQNGSKKFKTGATGAISKTIENAGQPFVAI